MVVPNRAVVTGAQDAGDHLMQCQRVFEDVYRRKVAQHPEASRFEPVDSYLETGGYRVFEHSLLAIGISASLDN